MWLKKRRGSWKRASIGPKSRARFEAQVLEPRRLLASVVVTTVSDAASHPGFVSLRDAVITADFDAAFGSSDTITFSPNLNGQQITLTQGVLELDSGGSSSAVITVDGGSQITVNGNQASSVFLIDAGTQAVIAGLTILHGKATDGGGIDDNGTLTVSNCTLNNNAASDEGAGIFAGGALTVSNSTISNNFSLGDAGGIYNDGTLTVSTTTFYDNGGDLGGGIDNDSFSSATVNSSTFVQNSGQEGGGIHNRGTLTVGNSTFSGNVVSFGGGGILDDGSLTVSASTFSGNSAEFGGGIYNYSGNASAVLVDSIVAGNTAAAEADGPDISGPLAGGSTFNLIGDGTAMTGIVNNNGGNKVGTSTAPIGPGLLPLGSNGGPTQTMALTASSVARNAGGSLTTLAASTDASVSSTSIPVGLASAIASTPGSYVIQVDSEQMLVTNVSGGTLTVSRGYNSTTVSAHNAGAKVYWATDQTGALRVGVPDIGAFEYQPITSAVNALPSIESAASFIVSWSGTPGSDGYPIASYAIYVSDNSGPFTLWDPTGSTSAAFTGTSGHTYGFYSIATDTAGDVQPTPAGPQATTTVQVPVGPSFTSATSADFTVGAASSFTVAAAGNPAPTYGETGTLPDGVTLDPTTGVLGGMPASGSVGAYPLTLTASNGVGSPATQSFTLDITKDSTKTTLTKSTTSAIKYGQSVTFTVTVTPAGVNALSPGGSGAVVLETNGTPAAQATPVNDVATFTFSDLPSGSISMSAYYDGDANFSGSGSGSLTQTVTQAATTTKLTKNTTGAITFGQSVTLTATMAAVSPGAGTPTGTVTFMDGSNVLGTGAVNYNGIAMLTTTAIPTGSNAIDAAYSGDSDFTASTSSSLSQTVHQSATTTALNANPTTTIKFGQAVTFTATMAAVAPGSGTPTGTVTFEDGAAVLGTGSLSSGVATLTSTSLAVGTHSIVAVYSGDSDFTTSTSSSLSEMVAQAATTTTLTKSSTGVIATGQSVTFSATPAAVSPAREPPAAPSPFWTTARRSEPVRSAAGSRR